MIHMYTCTSHLKVCERVVVGEEHTHALHRTDGPSGLQRKKRVKRKRRKEEKEEEEEGGEEESKSTNRRGEKEQRSRGSGSNPSLSPTAYHLLPTTYNHTYNHKRTHTYIAIHT